MRTHHNSIIMHEKNVKNKNTCLEFIEKYLKLIYFTLSRGFKLQ